MGARRTATGSGPETMTEMGGERCIAIAVKGLAQDCEPT